MSQLILIVEACKTSRSDYLYLKALLDYYYDSSLHKLSPIYAGSKTRLIDQGRKIEECVKRGIHRESQVFLCADYDHEKDPSNEAIKKYALAHGYEIIWMNRDIEEVFLGRKVVSSQKRQEAEKFLRNPEKALEPNKNLSSENPFKSHPSSNALRVFDRYLPRKRETKKSGV